MGQRPNALNQVQLVPMGEVSAFPKVQPGWGCRHDFVPLAAGAEQPKRASGLFVPGAAMHRN